MTQPLPASPIASLQTIELTPAHEALVQRFFVANPAYFLATQGEPARPQDAHEELSGELPPDFIHDRVWILGYLGPDGELVALANLVADLFVPGVWNLSTYIVATARHGSGDAQLLYQSIERWAVQCGARWMRLGVVQGHQRAERFWRSRGYADTSVRTKFRIGERLNTLQLMAKPLAGGTLEEYLALVPGDKGRPEG